MNGFYNTVREQAVSSGLPDEIELLATIQWRPGPTQLDDPDGYLPPREYLVTIGELKALPVVAEPPPPVVHDPNAKRVVLTADKNVRDKPASSGRLIKALKKGDEAWVIGVKQNNYMQLEDKSGWLYVAGLALADPANIPVPPPPPTQIAPKIKFGWHVAYDTTIDRLVIPHAERMKGLIAGWTIVNQPGLANKLREMGYRVMYRQYIEPDATYKTDWLNGKNYEQAYKIGHDFYFNGPHRATVVNVDTRCYIKLVNECGYHPMDYAFWIGCMNAADQDGRKLAIFGDSFGTPEIDQWPVRTPALKYAYARGHVVTLNQYGRRNAKNEDDNFPVSDDEGYLWYGGRHEQFYSSVPEDARPMLIIGETGASNSAISQPFAVADAIKYSKKLTARKYGDKILFFSLYTLGQWMQNRLDGQVPLAEQMLKTY